MGATRSFAVTEGMGSADGAFDKDRIPKKAGDPTRREFTYFMLGGARFIYASSARLALIKVIAMQQSISPPDHFPAAFFNNITCIQMQCIA